jgi:hypothetical protein
VGGVCQGRVITTVGGAEGASMTLSGTKLYVQLAGRIIVNGMNVFEGATDGSEPNGALIQGALGNTALDGKLYWRTLAGDLSSYTISSCTITSCSTTIAPLVTRPLVSGSTQVFTGAMVADPTNHQLVVLENQQIGTLFTEQFILRINTNATVQQVAMIGAPTGGTIYTPNNRPDRFFWFNQDTATFVPVYVSTSNTSGVPIPLIPTGQAGLAQQMFASDAGAYWMSVDTSFANPIVNGVPLPNGIVSGTAPLLYTGRFFDGVIDNSNAFGAFFPPGAGSTDAVSRCALSSCAPVAIARGQTSPLNFLTDSTQVYWLNFAGSTIQVFAAVK